MFKIEIIGNLGADAEIKNANGREFISFRLAHTEKYTNPTTGEITESTIWVSCLKQGDNRNLLPYLKKGQRIFVRGNAALRIYSSAKTHQMEAGINCSVWELEFCGSSGVSDEDKTTIAQARNIVERIAQLGYKDVSEIPKLEAF